MRFDNIKTPEALAAFFVDEWNEKQRLKNANRKSKRPRRRINKVDRQTVYDKTGGLCHVCGCGLTLKSMKVDHIQPHTVGGQCSIENMLPSCEDCNRARWSNTPAHNALALKLGQWIASQIRDEKSPGNEVATPFVKHLHRTRKRRSDPRS